MTYPPSNNNHNQYQGQDDADEISLIDLWLVLAKRKKLIGIVVLISISLGAALAFLKSPQYKFYTTIEVGSKVHEGKLQVIEDPKQLLAKITGSYIPLVLSRNMASDNTKDYTLDASLPKESQVIEIYGNGAVSDQDTYKKLLIEVSELIKKEHDYLVKVLREEESIKRNLLLSKKTGMDDQYKLLDNKSKRMEQAEALLKNQIIETKSLIDSGLKNRDKAIKQARDEAHAMTVMMIENGLQENRRLLAELENKLYIELANERDVVTKQLADLEREKKNIDLEVEKYLLQEGTYRSTRTILEPIRSRDPVGQSKRLILSLAAILGLFIAVFAAFFAEFLAKAKERSSAENA